MRLPFVRYSSGGRSYRGVRYFLPRDFKAWPTHEVTIARTFVHLFCTCLPTSSEKRGSVKRFAINDIGQRRGFLARHPGTVNRIDGSSFSYRSFPQTAATRNHCSDFQIQLFELRASPCRQLRLRAVMSCV
jgi:hypothetical protein